MSGFVGVRNREEPVTDELLGRLWQPIAHRGPDGEGRWSEGVLGLAAGVLRVTPESAGEEQPYRHRSGVVVVFDGRLDNRAEVVSALRSNGLDSHEPDVALVAEAYTKWGERFPERLNGEFALAVIDPMSRSVLLARDPVGTRPLAFAQTTSGDLVFGSEIKAILAHPAVAPRPNLDVLAEFVLGGNARARPWDTFFGGVSAVPPGVSVNATPDGARWRTHWAFDPSVEIRLRDHPDYVERYRDLFSDAVRRRLRTVGAVGVLVSGGLDSSSVLAIASREAKEIVAITFTFPSGSAGDESSYVKHLERAFDLRVCGLPMTHANIAGDAERQARLYELPALNEAFAAKLSLWDAFTRQGVRTYLTGLWGDQVLFDPTYLVDLFDGLRWSALARHLRSMPASMDEVDLRWVLRHFVSDLARWHVPRKAVPALRMTSARLRGPRHDQPWYTEDFRRRASQPATRPIIGGWARASAHARSLAGRLRSPYAVSAMEMEVKSAAWAGFEQSSPFLDRDLMAFVMGIPGAEVTPGGRQRGLHREALEGLLPEQIRLRTDKGDGTAMSNRSIAQQLPAMRSFVSNGGLAAKMGVIDERRLEEGFDRLTESIETASDFEAGLAVLDVLGLESWMRAFFTSPVEKGR